MFVRKLKHPNGRTYIQVVSKSSGKYKVVKSFGGSSDLKTLKELEAKAAQWIKDEQGLQELDFSNETVRYQEFLNHITALRLVGPELILGRIFDQIGFNRIEDDLFKSLVLYRLVYPRSKLKTSEYFLRYEHKSIHEDVIYRYMDKLHSSQKSIIQEISYHHTSKILGGNMQVVFYDVTTLYFEIDREDELRKTGFSKEGKHQHPQIVLGLLVSKGGYPLAYDIFEGNQFEGKTLLPIINAFRKTYKLTKLIVVADSGLLSKANIEGLIDNGQEFILGARIKNESQPIKDKILSLELGDGQSKIIRKGKLKLIITYSSKRAKKDAYNRNKGLRRLEKRMSQGKLNKTHLNKRGYNKYLQLRGNLEVSIDYEKFEQDKRWDGLKGYLTNSTLEKKELLNNYSQLWQIENAFRVAKNELKIRPIFHRVQRRIEAHICLCFTAFMVYKELERQLRIKKTELSPAKVIEIAQNIYQVETTTPRSKKKLKRVLILSEEQKRINDIFELGC